MDGGCDIWALGVMLYEMLSGRRPFTGADNADINHQICHRVPKSLRTINDHIPASLQTICMKCLEKRSQDRYNAADELENEKDQPWEGFVSLVFGRQIY